MRQMLAWWALLLLSVLLVVIGIQGSGGRVLAVIVTPARLQVQE